MARAVVTKGVTEEAGGREQGAGGKEFMPLPCLMVSSPDEKL